MAEKKKTKKDKGLRNKEETKAENKEAIIEKKKSKQEAEKKPKNYEKQTKVLVAIMVILILSVLVSHWIVQRGKKFTYKGFEFNKVTEDNLIFYQSILGYTISGGQESSLMLKLRTDPRTVDSIPLEGRLDLMKSVIFSYSPEIMKCPNTYRVNFDLSWTLAGVGVRNITIATNNKTYAKEEKIDYATCENDKENTVILMIEGNESKITREGDCYVLEIKDCEIQEVFTRFIVEYFVENIKK